jgi:hypothetical protein
VKYADALPRKRKLADELPINSDPTLRTEKGRKKKEKINHRLEGVDRFTPCRPTESGIKRRHARPPVVTPINSPKGKHTTLPTADYTNPQSHGNGDSTAKDKPRERGEKLLHMQE